jgi:SAM-dependent methyltransferase
VSVPAGGAIDYSGVTETSGNRVTREALSMLYTRYAFAAEFSEGRDVLEIACGAGPGLGYLARRARRVVGGDCTERLLAQAVRLYRRRIPLVRLDAHALPFRSGSVGVVLLYEALYYLAEAARFLDEAARVLRTPGCLMISTVNREWADFNPSPFSTRYFSGGELFALLRDRGFEPTIYGAFPVIQGSPSERMISTIRRAAVRLHLIPGTMRGKELLKRLFLGRLEAFPDEVAETTAAYCAPVRLHLDGPVYDFKVLFAVGQRS